MRAYEQKYTRHVKDTDNEPQNNFDGSNNNIITFSSKSETIKHVIDSIIDRVKSGEIFSLSKIRDQVNNLNLREIKVENRDVRSYLEQHYSDQIEYAVPRNCSKSILFYASTVSIDQLIVQVQPENILKESGRLIKKAMGKVDFELNDKFYDENTLRNSWENKFRMIF